MHPDLLAQTEVVYRLIGRYLGQTEREFEAGVLGNARPADKAAVWCRIATAWFDYHDSYHDGDLLPDEQEQKLVAALIAISEGEADVQRLAVSADIGTRLKACYDCVVVVPERIGQAEQTDQARREPPAVPSRRVFIVDDNPDAGKFLAKLLQRRGHQVSVVSDGASAIVLAVTDRPDLIFIDIGMPGMSGYEVAERLRGSQGVRGTVLVALTGYLQDEARKKAFESGFDHYLTKPADVCELERILLTLPRRAVGATF